MKSFLAAILCVFTISSLAQRTIDVDKNDVNAANSNFFIVVGGEPFLLAKFAKLVAGSPYFNDQWMKGNLVLNGGKQYSGLYLKLELLDNEIHYQDPKGNEMVATSEIQKAVLFDTSEQRVFTFVYSAFINTSSLPKGWYQLLLESKNASVFKQYNKKIQEHQPYNSATVEQTIVTSTRYFILYNSRFSELKKLKDIADILGDKKQELLKYISNNKLNGKSDDDFVSITEYYNSLKQ